MNGDLPDFGFRGRRKFAKENPGHLSGYILAVINYTA